MKLQQKGIVDCPVRLEHGALRAPHKLAIPQQEICEMEIFLFSKYTNYSPDTERQQLSLPEWYEIEQQTANTRQQQTPCTLSLSGMGAISAAILSTVGAGDLVIAQQDAYGGTTEFFRRDLPRYGVTVRFEDTNNLSHLEKLLLGPDSYSSVKATTSSGTGASPSEGGQSFQTGIEDRSRASTEDDPRNCQCRCCEHGQSAASTSGDSGVGGLYPGPIGRARKVVVFAETVSNPLLVLSDVRALAKLSKRAGAILMVDNTFGTPLRSQPLSEVSGRSFDPL